MRKFIFLFVLSMSIVTLQGQNDSMKTIFDHVKEQGYYMGFTGKYSQSNGLSGFEFGGRAMWILDHKIALGAGGYGFTVEKIFDTQLNDYYCLQGVYGGMFAEPLFFPNSPVHLALPVFAGAGTVDYIKSGNYWNSGSNMSEDNTFYWVVEPGIEIELNLTKFARLSFGATYKLTSQLELMNTEKNALNAVNVAITFKMGKF